MPFSKDNPFGIQSHSPTSSAGMILRKQLTHYLELRGMTASALARRASVPKQSISGWLAGNNPRDIRQLKHVADVLSITIDELAFGENGKRESMNGTKALELLVGDEWVSGLFEVKLRRVR